MFNLHGRASDAGPESRRLDPNEQYFECACGAMVTMRESYPCEGEKIADTCMARICESCRTKCGLCDLPMCPEHQIDFGGERVCHCCMEAMIAEGQEISKVAIEGEK